MPGRRGRPATLNNSSAIAAAAARAYPADVDECGLEAIDWDAGDGGPVVLSVPHAGRIYPPALLEALRAGEASARPLEDRHVDAVALAARTRQPTLVQQHARAWIDLNRREDERDPAVDEGADAGRARSAKLRAGLGLVPRRAAGDASLWRRRFTAAEIDRRIERDHRPYHAALAAKLAQSRARHGAAVLVDLHSMPSLGHGGARVVIGDRFGASAGDRFVAAALAALAAAGLRAALNLPYAGGHVVESHGRPNAGIHAVQIEIDRRLYLDDRLDRPGAGLAATAAAMRSVLAALADEVAAAAAGPALAAE